MPATSSASTIVSHKAGDAFFFPESWLIKTFCRVTKEYMLMTYAHVPVGHIVYFYYPTPAAHPYAFLWTALENRETGGLILRVHALYIHKSMPTTESKKITEAFERVLTRTAKKWGAKEIGFYTRRDPTAFCRRLNRTAPHAWLLDSHVVVRRV